MADSNRLRDWLPLPARWTADAPEAVHLCLSHEVDETRMRHGLETVAGLLGTPAYGAGLVL